MADGQQVCDLNYKSTNTQPAQTTTQRMQSMIGNKKIEKMGL
jgi:hypothetical protein